MSRAALALGLIGLGLPLVTSVNAQQRNGASGPIVLRVDPDSGRPRPPFRGDEREVVNAVPVPTVMNGGGFGLSGTDYYSDGGSEGRLGQGRRVNEYILAPALRSGPPGIGR